MSSLKPIGNIVVICCAFFIIFGILGVQVCRDGWPGGVCLGEPGESLLSSRPWVLLLLPLFQIKNKMALSSGA